MIAPIYKKRDPDRIENYRLLCTAYKLYADALTERLRAEVEEKSALSETQAGFRRKRRTIDNI